MGGRRHRHRRHASAFADPKDDALPAAPASRRIEESKPSKEPGGAARIRKTYDFTRLRLWTTLDSHPSTGPSALHQAEDLGQPIGASSGAPAIALGTAAGLAAAQTVAAREPR